MDMNKLKQSLPTMSCIEHLDASFVDTNLFGIAKVEDGEGTTVDGED